MLKYFLEDESYKNDLINLFNKGNDLEKFIALICVNGIVLSSLSRSKMKPLDETNPKLFEAMNQAALKTKDQYFKNHVNIIGRYVDGMDENSVVVAFKAPNSTNLVGSALVSFICYLHLKNQTGISFSKSALRATALFTYCLYHSTYQKSFANFLSERVHNMNSDQPLSIYNQNWNNAEYKTVFFNGMLWIVTYSLVRNWFAFAPLILF